MNKMTDMVRTIAIKESQKDAPKHKDTCCSTLEQTVEFKNVSALKYNGVWDLAGFENINALVEIVEEHQFKIIFYDNVGKEIKYNVYCDDQTEYAIVHGKLLFKTIGVHTNKGEVVNNTKISTFIPEFKTYWNKNNCTNIHVTKRSTQTIISYFDRQERKWFRDIYTRAWEHLIKIDITKNIICNCRTDILVLLGVNGNGAINYYWDDKKKEIIGTGHFDCWDEDDAMEFGENGKMVLKKFSGSVPICRECPIVS